MKGYESISNKEAVRLDGKSFHTFTRGFTFGYYIQCKNNLCKNIQGCVLLLLNREITNSLWIIKLHAWFWLVFNHLLPQA